MEKVRVLIWNEFLHEKEDEKVRKVVLINAVEWAKPSMGPKPTFGNVKPYENV